MQNIEAAPAALALNRIARIGQGLKFSQDESRDDQRPAQETAPDQVGDPTVDDDGGIDDERLVLGGLPRETHIRNNEGELVAVAAHGEHHPEIAERAVN